MNAWVIGKYGLNVYFKATYAGQLEVLKYLDRVYPNLKYAVTDWNNDGIYENVVDWAKWSNNQEVINYVNSVM